MIASLQLEQVLPLMPETNVDISMIKILWVSYALTYTVAMYICTHLYVPNPPEVYVHTAISKNTSHKIKQNSSCILAVFSAAIVHRINLSYNLYWRMHALEGNIFSLINALVSLHILQTSWTLHTIYKVLI